MRYTYRPEREQNRQGALSSILLTQSSPAIQVVHRDVKPENIIIEGGKPGGKVFLVDFGGIQQGEQDVADSEVTDTGTLVGTYGYMAPEQLRGSAKPASDLFALGGTLLYLLTGQYLVPHMAWPGVTVALAHADLEKLVPYACVASPLLHALEHRVAQVLHLCVYSKLRVCIPHRCFTGFVFMQNCHEHLPEPQLHAS